MTKPLTARIALELMSHEGIVPEAYKDSVGVWTWSIGITNASGHEVFPRYKDKPQPIERCIEVYLWLLETRYLPPVLAAFKGHDLTEAQLGAALSFHYNTGAISKATWVKLFLKGDVAGARASLMTWIKPIEIKKRRSAEAALFFDGKWSGDGTVGVWGVAKPSYHPKGLKRIDATQMVQQLMAGA